MTLRFVVRQQYAGQELINILHYAEGGGVSQADGDTIAEALADAWFDRLRILLSTEWMLKDIIMYDADGPQGTPGIFTNFPTGQFVGLATETPSPTQSAVYVRYVCQQGPPFGGGTYLGGFGSAVLDFSAKVDNTTLTAVNNWFTDIQNIDVGNGNTAQLVVRSRGTNTLPAGTTAVVTRGRASDVPAIQNRRRIGRGS